jgi:hypothetical protein
MWTRAEQAVVLCVQPVLIFDLMIKPAQVQRSGERGCVYNFHYFDCGSRMFWEAVGLNGPRQPI